MGRGVLAVPLLRRRKITSRLPQSVCGISNHGLSPEQRDKTVFPFADDERMDWHYVPKERRGLTLREINLQPRF